MTFTENTAANALLCARLSQLAYDTTSYVYIGCLKMGFDDSAFFEQANAEGFLAWDDENVVLAFRGTEPAALADWMTDADIAPIPFLTTGMHAHAGFVHALEAVWDDITAALAQHQHKRLFITGHSLGGALATLACVRLRWEQKQVHAVFTFGSPRVGQHDFCEAYAKIEESTPTYRYVNDTDVVSRIPTRLMGFGHVGKLFYFGPDGMLTPDDSLWDQFLLDVRGTVDDFLSERLGAFDCHRIGEYIACCEKNL